MSAVSMVVGSPGRAHVVSSRPGFGSRRIGSGVSEIEGRDDGPGSALQSPLLGRSFFRDESRERGTGGEGRGLGLGGETS